ncbi:MAG: SH3 domain-containing protein [Acidobacteria bacterium]|nr:SH3 domain-containing protein [Acidobacteriota bacterium]
MHGRRAALFLLSVVLFAQPPGQKLYPTDETSRDPAFQSYTRKLRSAVAARSTKALRRLMDDEEIIVGPGKEDQGWRKFVARWRPDDPDSKLWPALGDLLAVGFIREHPSLFLSPYVVWRFPSQLDRRKHLVIGRDKVALRESPSLAAATVTTLAFDIVRRAGEPVRSDRLGAFVPVETLDGRRGYVNARDVLSPLLPRAQFGFRQKRWVLIALETE